MEDSVKLIFQPILITTYLLNIIEFILIPVMRLLTLMVRRCVCSSRNCPPTEPAAFGTLAGGL